jgi:hypothetical protein
MPTYTERKAGVYRSTYTGWSTVTFDDKDNPGQEVTRWKWAFQEVADKSTAGQIDKLTGDSMASPNSNAYKMASGIVGRKLEPGDDTEAHVGELYDVVYGPNQAGKLTITQVIKITGAQKAEELNDAQELKGDLPF